MRPSRLALGCLTAALVAWAPACTRDGDEETPAATANRAGEVTLDEPAVRAAGIEVLPVSRRTFEATLDAPGVIQPLADRSVAVRALTDGTVSAVFADVGDRVARGQRLATIESAEATAALARWRVAVARQGEAERASERAERLVGLRAISRAEMELRRSQVASASAETEAVRQDLARLGVDPEAASAAAAGPPAISVTAPLAGVVLDRTASAGLLVTKDAALFEVADLSVVRAMVDLYEQDLGRVREQGEVDLRAEAYPDTHFRGRIERIEPRLDEQTRAARLRVVLDNPDGRLRPGLFVTVALPLSGPSGTDAIAVPTDAVQRIAGLFAVFVEKRAGVYEMRPVETGREVHGRTEIRHGLAEGERIVARGAFVLKSELLEATIEGEGDD